MYFKKKKHQITKCEMHQQLKKKKHRQFVSIVFKYIKNLQNIRM